MCSSSQRMCMPCLVRHVYLGKQCVSALSTMLSEECLPRVMHASAWVQSAQWPQHQPCAYLYVAVLLKTMQWLTENQQARHEVMLT